MITAELVKELRDRTGAGIMDCKKVLVETDGNIDKAIELLRERGIAKAAKKAGRIAAEGLVESYIHNGKINRLFEYSSYIVWCASFPTCSPSSSPRCKVCATGWSVWPSARRTASRPR